MADLGCSASAATAFDFLVGKGLIDFQAAAVIGNLQQESKLDPQALSSSEGAHGIAQWRGERWQNMLDFATASGRSPWSLDTQLEFLWHELETIPSLGLDALRTSTTLEEATIAFQDKFERCGICDTSNRISYANGALFACPKLAPPTRNRPVGVFTAATGVIALVAAAGYGAYEALRWRRA
jgi:hypothetical protein